MSVFNKHLRCCCIEIFPPKYELIVFSGNAGPCVKNITDIIQLGSTTRDSIRDTIVQKYKYTKLACKTRNVHISHIPQISLTNNR